ncbi:hypothetical protein [Actinoalloteichus spitiensis]|uniref:hypothetical protein n=1 Tax=Actinoalloteichus spitiensis TaxID=252394 RepID=UPI00036909CD|nr:hypothetical protein [Actinoalloteichus spitiensis]
MTDPDLASVASAVAHRATGGLTDGGQSAVTALARLVRARFGDDDRATGSLDAAAAEPEDEGRIADLGSALARTVAADPEFAAMVRELWAQAAEEGTAPADDAARPHLG